MNEQRVGLFGKVLWPGQCTALAPVVGVMNCVLVSDLGNAKALLTNPQTCNIHHDEHSCEALVFVANQIPSCAVIVHDAGRVAVNTHFMLYRTTANCVARAEGTIVVDHELGHDKQRNALYAVRRIGRFRQHQVNDVLGQVMLARRNENLSTGNRIRPRLP